MTRPRVEILSFEGCPNHEPTLTLVKGIAAELGVEPALELVEVRDADAVTRLRFLGSPTVRVDGRDVEPGTDARDDFAFSCRVYRSERGLLGHPDETWIREALIKAAA